MPEPQILAHLSRTVPLTVLDVGARGGAKDDLSRIAPGVDYVLFEPEAKANAALRAQGKGPWHSVTVLDTALGARDEAVTLNICAQPGCSSALAPLPEIAARFGRESYYGITGTAQMQVRPMDDLVAEGAVPPPHFLKIDVQGMEDQVFSGAADALSTSILGVRAEVNFLALYEGMPLWADLDILLRGHGMHPMRWIESHNWRRSTRRKYPKVDQSLKLPASQGQLVHADMLYLRAPEDMPHETEADLAALVRLALLAAAFDHLDHAEAALLRPGVQDWLKGQGCADPLGILAVQSRRLARMARAERIGARVARRFAGLFGGGP